MIPIQKGAVALKRTFEVGFILTIIPCYRFEDQLDLFFPISHCHSILRQHNSYIDVRRLGKVLLLSHKLKSSRMMRFVYSETCKISALTFLNEIHMSVSLR